MSLVPTGRRAKRVKNRLAKRGLTFIRFELGAPQLVTTRVILEARSVRTLPTVGRCFTYPHRWVRDTSPRALADAVLSDYVKRYGGLPRLP